MFWLNGKKYIKRVMAIEGDVVSSCENTLCVNEKPIEDCCYISEQVLSLQKDELFVVGDNYSVSIDSREFGIINKSAIIGLVR